METTDIRQQIVDSLDGGDRNTKVAKAIKDFCIKHEITSDMRIYFNGICWDFDSSGKYEVLTGIKGSEFFEYANDKSVSVSSEGGLCEHLNGYYGWMICNEFNTLLEKFNCYYELGNAWNFTIVFNDE